MTTSSVSYGSLADVGLETPVGRATRAGERAERGSTRRPFHNFLGVLDNGLMLLLVIWLLPLVILLIGAPVAPLVRLLMAITNRM